MEKEVPEIAEELNSLLSQIKGVTKVSEELTLSYIVQISDEENRSDVEKVGLVLAEQAKGYGFTLEVIPVTEEEVQLAKQKLEEHLASQN